MALTSEQSQAMQTFDKKFHWSHSLVFVGFTTIGLIFALAGRTSGAIVLLPIGISFVGLTGIYPLFVVLALRNKTGLTWHFMNAHSTLYADMLSALLALLFWFPSWLDMSSSVMTALILFLILALRAVLQWRLQLVSRQRAQSERDAFGEQWLKLRQLSFKDLLLLRIPDTRAQLGVTR